MVSSSPPPNGNDKLAPGTVLGRYELLLPIAQGGMATVWAARQKGSRGFQKTVAIKTMLPSLSDDPQFEQMFLDEATLASKIHHPNVAEILDLGEQDEVQYIVMEWVDGESLSAIARAAKKSDTHLPQRIVLRILKQACAGLHAAHELRDDDGVLLNLVHRDVSPQNVLVTYDGVVKLVDFGVAKAIGRAGGETTAGQLKGKVPYMSPEQAKGSAVDRRTDVFAMGIVLYKLTVGVHPFLGEDDMATMRNIILRPVLSPRMRNPNFSPELEQVLMKALDKDPERRYQSIADLDRALERVLAVTGASVVDDDVGSLVRAVMGDRGQKRRAAIRDAIRAVDERPAGAPAPGVASPDVSDLLLTKLASGVAEEILPDRLSELGPAPPPLPPAPDVVGGDAAMAEELRRGRSRSGVLLAAAATTTAALGIAFVMLRGSGSPSHAETPAQVSAAPTAATTAPAAATATATASAAPASSASTDGASVSVTDLPSADDKDSAKKKGPAGPPGAAKASADPDAKAPPKPLGSVWVPPVRNPGF